eukprot:Hpha_TRINITY_DN19067_c0_g1::TRINITY_DN19067_c0_g1_i1::g.138337::m.138337
MCRVRRVSIRYAGVRKALLRWMSPTRERPLPRRPTPMVCPANRGRLSRSRSPNGILALLRQQRTPASPSFSPPTSAIPSSPVITNPLVPLPGNPTPAVPPHCSGSPVSPPRTHPSRIVDANRVPAVTANPLPLSAPATSRELFRTDVALALSQTVQTLDPVRSKAPKAPKAGVPPKAPASWCNQPRTSPKTPPPIITPRGQLQSTAPVVLPAWTMPPTLSADDRTGEGVPSGTPLQWMGWRDCEKLRVVMACRARGQEAELHDLAVLWRLGITITGGWPPGNPMRVNVVRNGTLSTFGPTDLFPPTLCRPRIVAVQVEVSKRSIGEGLGVKADSKGVLTAVSGPALASGLRTGMRVVSINGIPVPVISLTWPLNCMLPDTLIVTAAEPAIVVSSNGPYALPGLGSSERADTLPLPFRFRPLSAKSPSLGATVWVVDDACAVHRNADDDWVVADDSAPSDAITC